MEIKSIREFEVDFKGVAYVIDFDVYYYVEEEKATHYYPGAWGLIIDGFAILSVNFYNPDSDQWETSRMMDSQIENILMDYEDKIKDLITLS